MSDSYFSGDVRQAVGYSSPGFKGEIRAGDINMGVNVQIVFKAMRLDEITKRVSFKRRGPKTESWDTANAKNSGW